eukprot:5625540-Prymnesium_polylepis.1
MEDNEFFKVGLAKLERQLAVTAVERIGVRRLALGPASSVVCRCLGIYSWWPVHVHVHETCAHSQHSMRHVHTNATAWTHVMANGQSC